MFAGNPSSTTHRRRAFIAAFLGWMLDGYDYTLLTLVVIDIEREFHLTHAAAGALGTVTLVTRLIGGVVAGVAADRWGRKRPLVVSILWFSMFAFLSGLSPSYGWLLLIRALFGLGMGGEWAAGMPLVLEHWPRERHGFVLGILQGAYSWGYILAGLAFQLSAFLPAGLQQSTSTWRLLMWTGILPALLTLWIRRHVVESPLWMASQAERISTRPAKGTRPPVKLDAVRIMTATMALAAMMFAYQSMSFWYATLLRDRGLEPFIYLVALNVGGIAGAAVWGRLADTRLGPRTAIVLGSVLSLAALPAFLWSDAAVALWLGALSIGATGAGMIGVAPSFIGRQFETKIRATSWGIAYHAAAAGGALAPLLIGQLQDAGWSLPGAMAASIGTAYLATVVLFAVPQRYGGLVKSAEVS